MNSEDLYNHLQDGGFIIIRAGGDDKSNDIKKEFVIESKGWTFNFDEKKEEKGQ